VQLLTVAATPDARTFAYSYLLTAPSACFVAPNVRPVRVARWRAENSKRKIILTMPSQWPRPLRPDRRYSGFTRGCCAWFLAFRPRAVFHSVGCFATAERAVRVFTGGESLPLRRVSISQCLGSGRRLALRKSRRSPIGTTPIALRHTPLSPLNTRLRQLIRPGTPWGPQADHPYSAGADSPE